MYPFQTTKRMTHGEAGLTLFFAVMAYLCLIAGARALDGPFALHASLGFIASGAAAFAILNRYFDRPAASPAQEINGRLNYNMAPIKFSAVMSVIWGIAGFEVGLLIASQLAWPALNLDLPWTSFGRLRPLHTSAVIFAFGGNVLIASSLYVVQKTCRTRLPAILHPGSSSSATISSFWSPAPAICLASRSPRNMPSRSGTQISG